MTSIKTTQDGIYIFVATDEEVRCFRKDNDRWIAQQSVWRKMDHASDEREVLEDLDKIHTALDVSADGSLVALCGSTGQVLFFPLLSTKQKEAGRGREEKCHSFFRFFERPTCGCCFEKWKSFDLNKEG